jgi:hypothetical protein
MAARRQSRPGNGSAGVRLRGTQRKRRLALAAQSSPGDAAEGRLAQTVAFAYSPPGPWPEPVHSGRHYVIGRPHSTVGLRGDAGSSGMLGRRASLQLVSGRRSQAHVHDATVVRTTAVVRDDRSAPSRSGTPNDRVPAFHSAAGRTRRRSRDASASCLAAAQPHLPWRGARRMRLAPGGSLSVATLRSCCAALSCFACVSAAASCLGVRRSATLPASSFLPRRPQSCPSRPPVSDHANAGDPAIVPGVALDESMSVVADWRPN